MNLSLYCITVCSILTLHSVKTRETLTTLQMKWKSDHVFRMRTYHCSLPWKTGGWLSLKERFEISGRNPDMAARKHSKFSCSRHDHSSFACAAVNQPCRSPLWEPFDLAQAHQDKHHHSMDTLIAQRRLGFQLHCFSYFYHPFLMKL